MPTTQKKHQNQKQKLLEMSLRYLGYRARSKHEIQTYLEGKSQDLETIESVLSELISFGFVNDEKFASDYINSRLRSRPKGEFFIRSELTRKFGIEKNIVDQKIKEINLGKWVTAAAAVLSKKAKNLSKLTGFKLKAKLYYYLKSRGFSEQVITIAIDEFDSGK